MAKPIGTNEKVRVMFETWPKLAHKLSTAPRVDIIQEHAMEFIQRNAKVKGSMKLTPLQSVIFYEWTINVFNLKGNIDSILDYEEK